MLIPEDESNGYFKGSNYMVKDVVKIMVVIEHSSLSTSLNSELPQRRVHNPQPSTYDRSSYAYIMTVSLLLLSYPSNPMKVVSQPRINHKPNTKRWNDSRTPHRSCRG